MPSREEMQNLAHQIIGAYDERAKSTADLRATVGGQMAGFHSDRQAMARSLRSELSRGQADLRATVGGQMAGFHSDRQAMAKEMRAELARDSSDRRAGVGAMLKGLDRAHQAMAKSQRADLARGYADCKAAVGGMIKEFQHEQAGVRREQAGGRAAWQKMAATMGARRGSASAVAMARPKAPASPRPAVAAKEAREFAALRTRVLEYLVNHPDGTRLVELEGEMGASRFQMSRVVKSLMDGKKVEKRDLQYFAI